VASCAALPTITVPLRLHELTTPASSGPTSASRPRG
jgi:hypothetical protein